MEQKEFRLLRFFAEDKTARENAIQDFVQAGKLEAMVREKNDETLLLLTSRLDSDSAGKVLLDRCVELEQQACGGALYATEDKSLFTALIEAMHRKDMLFVAADTEICQLLNEPLSRVENAGAVYDFGACSCDHAKNGGKIRAAGEGKTPLAAAQDRVHAACCLTGADWAADCYTDDEGVTLVVGNQNGCWVYAMQDDQRPVLWVADLLRRAALGCQQALGVLWVQADTVAQLQPHRSGYAMRTLSLSFLTVLLIAGISWVLAGWFVGVPGGML